MGIAGSVLLHGLLVAALLHVTARAPAPLGHIEPEAAESVTRLRGAADSSLVQVAPLAEGITSPAAADCPDKSYVGIGILLSYATDVIRMVGENTPASRAGLLVGDLILNPDELGINFEEGRVLHLRVSRDGAELPIAVAVRRICQE